MQEHLFKNKIYYRANEFVGGRPTLVFVHGLGGSSSAWLPYEKRFEDQYNMLSIDLRGHGKSIRLPEYKDYEIKKFAQDLHELISDLHLSKYVLVSHSLGTLIVLEYLVHFGTDVGGIVMLSPNFKVGHTLPEKILHPFIELSRVFDYLPLNANKRGHADYTKYPHKGDWNLPRMFADIKNTTPRTYFFGVRQVYGFDREHILEKIRVPCLLIHGKKDTIFSVENSIYMNKKIKNSELIILPGTDHIIALNNVREICDAIETFIENNKKALY